MSSQTSTSTAVVGCSQESAHPCWRQNANNTTNMHTKQVAQPQHARTNGYGTAPSIIDASTSDRRSDFQ